jgi:hypothetical protein
MSARKIFLLVVAGLFSCVWSCSSDDTSGFEGGPGDGDSSILNDVQFQPLDSPPGN